MIGCLLLNNSFDILALHCLWILLAQQFGVGAVTTNKNKIQSIV